MSHCEIEIINHVGINQVLFAVDRNENVRVGTFKYVT